MSDLDSLLSSMDELALIGSLDADFYRANSVDIRAAYNGSLDAAKRLHDALLPGWKWHLWVEAGATVFMGKDRCIDAFADNPARAWLLAILRAVKAKAQL